MRSHVYEEKSKLTKGVIGDDANSLYLYCNALWQRHAGYK